MRFWRRMRSGWGAIFGRARVENELDAELRFHVEAHAEDLVRSGLSREEALRQARLKLGGLERTKEECRDALGVTFVESLIQDVRFGLRMLRKNPGFTLTAVAIVTLGIGANVAVFSVVNTVILKPLKAPDADRIVQVEPTYQGVPGTGTGLPEFNLWKQQTNIFQDTSAYRLDRVNLIGGSSPELIPVARVTLDFFRLFGAPVLKGRTFTTDEDRPHGGNVAVLSYGFWTRRFENDSQVLGKAIVLGSESYVVIGILGPNFDTEQFDRIPDVWLPFQIEPNTDDHGSYCYVAARLRTGVTLGKAIAQLKAVVQEYRRRFPAFSSKEGFTVQPLREAMGNNSRRLIMLLVGAVIFVLLIACANVANLLLARASGRMHEIAIRAAVGAGRGRVVRQLLTESTLLSLVGGALGLLFGMVGIRALLALYPGNLPLTSPVNPLYIPRIGESGSAVTLDWRVLGFTVLASLATAVLFGILPAFQASRADLNLLLKENSARSGFRQHKTRSLLVISEIALALVMLIGSALLIRTYIALRSVNPGFNSHNVLTMQMSLTGTRFEKTSEMDQLVRDGVRRVQALPGVTDAAATCCLPLETVWQLPLIVVGRPLDGPYHRFGGWTFISPDYFDVFNIPLMRGRAFTERDDANAQAVVIINEAMAKALWPKSDPLGDRLVIGRGMRPEYDKDSARQIIGIVGDVRDTVLDRPPRPAMYVPIAQLPDSINVINLRLLPITWIVRTRVAPYSLSLAIRSNLEQASGGLPASGIRSMDEVESQATARTRFEMMLMTVFGCSALLLAAIGIYGLMEYSVQQRKHEMGIRLALGAESRDVRNMIVFQGMRLTFIGAVLGIGTAFGLTRLIAGFLFGVRAWDPGVFIAAPVLLSAVGLLAVWLPARRAATMNPMVALRHE
ncbi:MAG TPA: ABC transporter permease [Candidatus Acidoferrales bacterium]|nr:ABC transporter permease [Candidatus Acidoferrales bacterium]